jgi:hypothetical protein
MNSYVRITVVQITTAGKRRKRKRKMKLSN